MDEIQLRIWRSENEIRQLAWTRQGAVVCFSKQTDGLTTYYLEASWSQGFGVGSHYSSNFANARAWKAFSLGQSSNHGLCDTLHES
jgi:hypothetical protein